MKTKLIFEIGCNHNGSMETAARMIIRAKKLGAWAVKFQKRDIEAIPEDIKYSYRDTKNSFGETYYTHRAALEFSFDQMRDLKKMVENCGMVFSCSAFDEESFEFLIDIKTEYIKLPSQLFLDKRFFTEKGNRDYRIIVSTGMHDQEEIFFGHWIEHADIVMHCISVYPCFTADINIRTLKSLESECKGEVGYSSHDYHGYGIPFAIIAGAKYIERHFSMDVKMKGADHSTVSSDPVEMEYIINRINDAEKMIGGSRMLSEAEKKIRRVYRGV